MKSNKQKVKHDLGQYFTTNILLKNKVLEFIQNNPSHILEPSVGQGDLVKSIKTNNSTITFDMYEIDESINILEDIDRDQIIYGDFIAQEINKKYKTIVGNPPFVRTKKGNLYIDFTEKCYNLLDINGELIFIIPSDFLKLTSASNLLNNMMQQGSFTHIFHPHDEKLFTNANIDVIVFRYCKNKSIEKKVLYNDTLKYITNSDGLITFNEKANIDNVLFKEYFDIYVGLVSGKEDIYKNSILGNIDVLNGENKIDRYIYISDYPSHNESINTYLLEHKEELISRRIKKFNEKNWFEWGAPRNIKSIEKNLGKDCIYLYTLTRSTKVAFTYKVTYFGGSLIMLKPKKKCDLQKITNYLNSNKFKGNFIFSGRFKIGHRQISNSYIPNEFLNSE